MANPAPAEGQGAPAAQPPRPRGGAHTLLCRLAGFRPRLLRAQPVSADLRPGTRAPAAPRPRSPSPGAAPARPERAGGGIAADLGPRRAASGPAGAGERGGAAGRGGAAAGSREPSLLCVRRPPGAAMEVYIPSFRYEESDLERAYTPLDWKRKPRARGAPGMLGIVVLVADALWDLLDQ
ncbi:sorting nexin-24 isoform X8 [Myotis daubentonii]|uniref:sorting nexin-24 isoform X8 n=1 Tax=Myotis daubentonii TaxID=98922 RepID=UPI002873A036|nr:sorting nexin-24 isoform X8 [Myotis daubentonii]